MAENDPRPLTRAELAQFLPNQRAIRAFEKLFDLIPPDLIDLDDRLSLLENPVVHSTNTDLTLTTEAYVVKVTANGLTITLPPGDDEIRGRVWSIILASEGPLTIQTSAGDSIPVPNNPAETTLMLKAGRRGSAIALRYLGDNIWSFA
jgi:hypothetical protein